MPRQDEDAQGESAAAKDSAARDKTGKDEGLPLGTTRAPTPANAGNVGLGGKTGSVTPRERGK
jgi:hypothetical protein